MTPTNGSINLGLLTPAGSYIRQTINDPTLPTSAGAIVLLIFSTAFETPARDKQTMTDPDRRRPCRAGRQMTTVHLIQSYVDVWVYLMAKNII